MKKKAAKEASTAAATKEKTKQSTPKKASRATAVKKKPKSSSTKKAAPLKSKAETPKPGLRSVYSNSKHTLLPLGFATDFKTKKNVVIFSDLSTGQVHTILLSQWNRWKLKEVKKINTET